MGTIIVTIQGISHLFNIYVPTLLDAMVQVTQRMFKKQKHGQKIREVEEPLKKNPIILSDIIREDIMKHQHQKK